MFHNDMNDCVAVLGFYALSVKNISQYNSPQMGSRLHSV